MKQCVLIILFVISFGAGASSLQAEPMGHAKNLIVVTIDGMRWQEIFGGADTAILNPKNKKISNPAVLMQQYLRPTLEEQRARLMPFLWNVVAKQGQIFGDRESNCIATVSNPHHFSYPGYSELTVGYVEPKIDSNDDVPNPNPTVFEWLNHNPDFTDKIAAFGAWDRLHAIINPDRSGIFVMAGWRPIPSFKGQPLSDREQQIDQMMKHDVRYWPDEPFDIYCESEAIEFFKLHHPRVTYVMLGETDDWAHANRYDLYLSAAERSDDFVRRLWELAQATPGYTGNTSLLITCDHGRGNGPVEWTTHGPKVVGSEGIWIAIMGPDTPADGVRKDLSVSQSQVAATIANLLGQDYRATVSKAAPPLPNVVRQ